MAVQPDLLVAFLARAQRRRALIDALRAASLALFGAATTAVLIWLASPAVVGRSLALFMFVAFTAALAAALFWRTRKRRSLASTARALEQAAPAFRNLLITSVELFERPGRARPEVSALVYGHALRTAQTLDADRLFPLGRPGAAAAAAFLAAVAVAGVVLSRPAPSLARVARTIAGTVALEHVDVVVEPPPYSRRPSTTLRDPAEIRALAGSRLRLRLDTRADAATIETLAGTQIVTRQAGAIAADLVADRNGFISISLAPRDAAAPPRLMGLAIDDDRPPIVRIVKPGRDLFLARLSDTIPIETVAEDDVGLASLHLTYTTVSGSGENFEFRTGELPLIVDRRDDRRWGGTAALRLSALKVSPGDTVVYRTTARDVRPGAQPVDSDAFVVQIASPERAIAGGFTIEDEFNRYAISQQMVILKTERLAAERRTLPAAAFTERAQEIAAEQRRVRAEFVFMMGGEMEDLTADPESLNEIEEAERESEIAEGRLQNRGAVDVRIATRYMARAAMSLAASDTTRALPDERRALAALQRAFSKDRYLLRTLSSQQALDPSRRLGGKMDEVSRDTRAPSSPAESPRTVALRRALAGVAALTRPADGRAHELAREVVAVDPVSPVLRDIARAITSGDFDRAAHGLAAAIRADLRDAPRAPVMTEERLRGALAESLRSRSR